MHEGDSRVSEKQDGLRKMSATDWTAEIETFAGPFSGNRKGWLSVAARRAGVTYRQIKALYYRETTDPKHSVATRVLSAAEQARLDAARRDARQLADTYRSAANALANVDEDFHRSDIDALVNAARVLGVMDRA
jgi:hypothetical protein